MAQQPPPVQPGSLPGSPGEEVPAQVQPVQDGGTGGDSDPAQTKRWPWIDDLPYRPIPPLGNPPVLPTGPGYYSLLDLVRGNYRDGPPKSPYPPYALMRNSLYDADFRYLDDPNYHSEDFFDRFHNVHIGDNWLFGTGGQADIRFMDQSSRLFSGNQDQFALMRARVFGDLWFRDIFRVYAELIASTSVGQDLPPLKTDIGSIDFLNLFIGLKLFELDGNPAYLRVGRQELMFGSQRLISPLEWANTRQTFQGVRGLWSNGTIDADAFWMRPVIPTSTGWAEADARQNFVGTWFSYHPNKEQVADLYWLYLDNSNKSTTLGITQDPTIVHTLGSRYARTTVSDNGVLWDFEPMLQLGARGPQSIVAGAATGGFGYYFGNLPMTPTVWTYYDWASGSQNPGHGNYSTFNQLYTFGHYYLGFMDLIGRQNIRDLNTQVYLFPAKWINLNIQYHFLNLDSAKDALYGPGGTPLRVSPTGSAGKNVGQELTFILNFHLGAHSDILTGYSVLFAGEYIRNTAPTPAAAKSPQMCYAMYNFRW
jgi:hypothetical protein